MSLDHLDETLRRLISEFESSGMNINEFIERKLGESGRSDAAEVVRDISATLNDIDSKFESLQKFKENGGNREEWLRQELDNATQGIPSDKVGQVLSSSEKVLNGESSDAPDTDANYDAYDAAQIVRRLDDAIVKNTCQDLEKEME